MSRFSRLTKDLDLTIAILLSLVLAAMGTFGAVAPAMVGAATLVVLALMVSIFFKLRRQLARVATAADRHTEALRLLQATVATKPRASDVMRFDYPDLSEMIEQAGEIWVVAGTTFRTTVGSYLYQFQIMLERGGRIRLVCPDPNNQALMSEAAFSQSTTMHEMMAGITGQLDLTRRLTSAKGHCEIRLAPVLPTIGLVKILTAGKPSVIYAKLLPFSYTAGAAPVFEVSSSTDEKLFRILDGAIIATWEISTALPIGPSPVLTPPNRRQLG